MPESSYKFASPHNAIISELDRQLEEWRACLPPSLQFVVEDAAQDDLSTGLQPRTTVERLRGYLIARYFIAKSIIYRPFVYRALHSQPSAPLSDAHRQACRTAVVSAVLTMKHGGPLNERVPLWLYPINAWRRYVNLSTAAVCTDPMRLKVLTPNVQSIRGRAADWLHSARW